MAIWKGNHEAAYAIRLVAGLITRDGQAARLRHSKPTACDKPAKGKRAEGPELVEGRTSAALGSAGQNGNKPQRGATNRASIPHVSFINLHAMFPAKRTELILIRHPAMVLLLRRDICPDLLDIRLAHGK